MLKILSVSQAKTLSIFCICVSILMGCAGIYRGGETTTRTPQGGTQTGCPPGAAELVVTEAVPIERQFSGNGDQAQLIATNTTCNKRAYTVSIDSRDSAIWRLYFSVANTTNTRVAPPRFAVINSPTGMRHGAQIQVNTATIDANRDALQQSSQAATFSYRVPATKHVHLPLPAELEQIHSHTSANIGSIAETLAQAPNNQVGNRNTFTINTFNDQEPSRIDAVARYRREVMVNIGGATVSIRIVLWVPDSMYSGCTMNCSSPSDGLLTETEMTMVADAFLKDGGDNDIYDLMHAIFGAHWGTHTSSTRLIPANYVKQIDFLLYNIGGRTGGDIYEAGNPAGYYWSLNNYLKTSSTATSTSNERLLLMIHAPWLKVSREHLRTQGVTNNEQQEKVINRFRQQALVALAHEYQHMIHFYQRFVEDPPAAYEDTWINEQFSMMTQDLLYRSILGSSSDAIDGRGIIGPSAGEYGICEGLIPSYLPAHGYRGVSQWENELWNYGVVYSFGAYLLRNYGGVAFIRDAYRTQNKNAAAFTYALQQRTNDSSFTMGEAIRRWGVAALLSDQTSQTSAPIGYRLNNGSRYFQSSYNGVRYDLGSINYYNYATPCSPNPTGTLPTGALRIFRTNASIQSRINLQDGYSVIPIAAAENLRGKARFTVTLSPGQALTAIAKRARTSDNPTFY